MGGNQSPSPGFTGSSWPKNRSWRLRCDFEGIFKACLLRFLEFFCPLRFQDAFKSILTDKIDRKYSPKWLKIENKTCTSRFQIVYSMLRQIQTGFSMCFQIFLYEFRCYKSIATCCRSDVESLLRKNSDTLKVSCFTR